MSARTGIRPVQAAPSKRLSSSLRSSEPMAPTSPRLWSLLSRQPSLASLPRALCSQCFSSITFTTADRANPRHVHSQLSTTQPSTSRWHKVHRRRRLPSVSTARSGSRPPSSSHTRRCAPTTRRTSKTSNNRSATRACRSVLPWWHRPTIQIRFLRRRSACEPSNSRCVSTSTGRSTL